LAGSATGDCWAGAWQVTGVQDARPLHTMGGGERRHDGRWEAEARRAVGSRGTTGRDVWHCVVSRRDACADLFVVHRILFRFYVSSLRTFFPVVP